MSGWYVEGGESEGERERKRNEQRWDIVIVDNRISLLYVLIMDSTRKVIGVLCAGEELWRLLFFKSAGKLKRVLVIFCFFNFCMCFFFCLFSFFITSYWVVHQYAYFCGQHVHPLSATCSCGHPWGTQWRRGGLMLRYRGACTKRCCTDKTL